MVQGKIEGSCHVYRLELRTTYPAWCRRRYADELLQPRNAQLPSESQTTCLLLLVFRLAANEAKTKLVLQARRRLCFIRSRRYKVLHHSFVLDPQSLIRTTLTWRSSRTGSSTNLRLGYRWLLYRRDTPQAFCSAFTEDESSAGLDILGVVHEAELDRCAISRPDDGRVN